MRPATASEPKAAVETPRDRPALRPLFRWPGGKRWLIPRAPRARQRLAGLLLRTLAGRWRALSSALRPRVATLGDANGDLINCYKQILDDPNRLAGAIKRLPRGHDGYYEVRDSRARSDVGRAARFLYLTTLAFNGIYRVNKRLEGFNVPFSGRTYPDLGSFSRLRSYSEALKHAITRRRRISR